MPEKEALFKNFNNQRWSFADITEQDTQKVSQGFGVDSLIAKTIIDNLNLTDINHLKSVLKPDQSLHQDLSDFVPDEQLDKAVKRIRQAQINTEIAFVNGDPDADGIGGTAILVAGLRQLGIETRYIFPIRPTEGHGLQIRIIEEAKAAGSTLIFTADCGTKDVAAVEYAKSLGIDVIITDHHILGHKLPDALAIINPYLVEKKTMFQDLAGSSVSFKIYSSRF